jgi:aconitase B
MFKIVQNSDAYELTDIAANNKAVEYVFEHNDNILKSLSNYLSKNNINLLCMDRITKSTDSIRTPVKQEIKDIVRSLDISLLLTGNQNSSYNKQYVTLNKN